MERMRSGRAWLACLAVFFTLHVCLASVTVQVKPTVDVILGETARMPCSSTGNKGVVQWFIEHAGTRKRVAFWSPTDHGVDKDTPFAGRVAMEADMTLVITTVKVSDERSFFCQVDGGAVGTSEAESKLRVFLAPAKPVVSENNQHIPLTPDTPTTHQVGKCTSSNGHPEPRIIWFKDSKPLPDRTDPKEPIYMVPGVVKESSGLFTVTSALYIQPTKADAKSVFHCTVEYRMPNEMIKKENSENFNLTLLYPAENVFFKMLNMSQIKEGDDVHMKCETDGNPQPQFEFIRYGLPKQSEDGLFIVHNVTRSDSGTYKCEAMDFDADADLTKTLNLTVHWLDPVSVVPASPLMINKGDRIELQCRTKSSAEYTVSWMKNGNQLSQKGVLEMHSAKLDDAGKYVCKASVPSVPGLQKQAKIEIIVSGQPEIDKPNPVTVKRQGDMVTLMCSAQGYPAPQFTWTPSGKESVNISGNWITSTVTLEATAAVLKDGVTCEVNNEHGSNSKKFKVDIHSDNTVNNDNGGARADTQEGGSKGVVVAVLVCVLLLLILVAVLYFLGKRGRMACRKKEKNEVASGDVNNDIVVEMKSGEKPNEESGLLNKPHVEQ